MRNIDDWVLTGEGGKLFSNMSITNSDDQVLDLRYTLVNGVTESQVRLQIDNICQKFSDDLQPFKARCMEVKTNQPGNYQLYFRVTPEEVTKLN